MMFELVLFAALSHSISTTAGFPTYDATTVAPGVTASVPVDISPLAFADATGISWRASVEAASAGDFDGDSTFSRVAGAEGAGTPDLALSDSVTPRRGYDALLAKRWHWFELYGVSRLHVVPKEARHPWWFAY